MKKVAGAIAFVLVIALSLAVAVGAQGCGGDAGRAKSFMKQGDAELARMNPASEQLQSAARALFEGVFAGGAFDAAAFRKNAHKVRKAASDLEAAGAPARNSYSSIRKLKDVEGYRKYAAVRIKELDLNDRGIALLRSFIDTWSPATGSTGVDPVAFVGAAKDLGTATAGVASEIRELEVRAATLKQNGKL